MVDSLKWVVIACQHLQLATCLITQMWAADMWFNGDMDHVWGCALAQWLLFKDWTQLCIAVAVSLVGTLVPVTCCGLRCTCMCWMHTKWVPGAALHARAGCTFVHCWPWTATACATAASGLLQVGCW
jgi:hypothetical protein